jgi:hypothetical protein
MVLELVARLLSGGWIVADVSYSDADGSTQLTQYRAQLPELGGPPNAEWVD